MRRYSRLASVEEKRNTRQAILFIFLTICSLVALFVFGLPALAKFASILTDLGKSGKTIEKSDTTPPAPPHLSDLPEATNSAKIAIAGTAEPGATITLFINEDKKELVAGNDGVFSLNYALTKGVNTIYANAKDASGNESMNSETLKVIFDKDPPSLEITSPQDGSSFFGLKQKQVNIQGKTEGDANLTINDRVVKVGSDGSFSYTASLSSGDNSLTIKSQDKAGNETNKSITLHYSE